MIDEGDGDGGGGDDGEKKRDKECRERDELSSQLHSNITSAPMISSRSSYGSIGAHVIKESFLFPLGSFLSLSSLRLTALH